MQFITYYLLKVVLSVLLLFVIAFACRELVRLWTGPRISLGTFSYQQDATENEAQGAAFRKRVYHELRALQRLFEGGQSGSTPTPTRSMPGQITTLVPPPRVQVTEGLSLPEIKRLPLQDIEINVHGVDFTSLARGLAQWVDPPDEFYGSVLQQNGTYSSIVEWRRVGRWNASDEHMHAENHSNVDAAAFATACNILYMLISDRDPSFARQLTRSEFEIFARSLRAYSNYVVSMTEMRPLEEVNTAQEHLAEADRLAAGLIERIDAKPTDATHHHFTPVYVVGVITALVRNDLGRAREYLAIYRKQSNASETLADELAARLPPPPLAATAAMRAEDPETARGKFRPVQPGVSAASELSTAGTICCLVADKDNPEIRYLLSSEHAFLGEPGTAVTQPSPIDGGTVATELIARVAKIAAVDPDKPNRVAGALAAVTEGTMVNPECFGIGSFANVSNVKVGEQVTLMGRSSGQSKGVVVGVDSDVSVWVDAVNGGVRFSGVITCQNVDGTSFSANGDSGAPVVNANNELVGMLYAGSDRVSIVLPIQAIFDHFGVELVTDLATDAGVSSHDN